MQIESKKCALKNMWQNSQGFGNFDQFSDISENNINFTNCHIFKKLSKFPDNFILCSV